MNIGALTFTVESAFDSIQDFSRRAEERRDEIIWRGSSENDREREGKGAERVSEAERGESGDKQRHINSLSSRSCRMTENGFLPLCFCRSPARSLEGGNPPIGFSAQTAPSHRHCIFSSRRHHGCFDSKTFGLGLPRGLPFSYLCLAHFPSAFHTCCNF